LREINSRIQFNIDNGKIFTKSYDNCCFVNHHNPWVWTAVSSFEPNQVVSPEIPVATTTAWNFYPPWRSIIRAEKILPLRSFFRGLAHRPENNIRTLRLCLPTFFLFCQGGRLSRRQQQIHDRLFYAHRLRLKVGNGHTMGHTLNGQRVPHKSRELNRQEDPGIFP